MSATTLQRDAAHQLVDDCYTDNWHRFMPSDAMRQLAAHWDIAGHWNENATADDWYTALHEHVDQCASGDDARSNGPKDSDDTGLTAPEFTEVQP